MPASGRVSRIDYLQILVLQCLCEIIQRDRQTLFRESEPFLVADAENTLICFRDNSAAPDQCWDRNWFRAGPSDEKLLGYIRPESNRCAARERRNLSRFG